MPIIPRTQEDVAMNVSSPVPVRGSESAGAFEKAQGDFFGQVANFAGAVNDAYTRQRNAEAELKENQAQSSISDAALVAREKAKKAANEDGSNYREIFQKEFDNATKDVYKPLDGFSQTTERVKQFQNQVAGHVGAQIEVESLGMLEKTNYKRASDLADQSADRIRGNPNESMVAAEVKSYGSMIDSLVANNTVSATNGEKARQYFYNKVAEGYVDGLGNQGSYSKGLNALKANQEDPNLKTMIEPAEAKRLGFITQKEADQLTQGGKTYDLPVMTKGSKVKLSPEMSAVMNSMDPLRKDQLIDHYKNKALVEAGMKLSDLNASLNSFEVVAMSGGNYTEKQVADLKQKINQNPQMTLFARQRAMDAVNVADVANKQIKLTSDLPRSRWNEIIDGFDSKVELASQNATKYDSKMAGVGADLAVQANRLEVKAKLENYLKQQAKAQDEDAAKWVVGTDSRISNLLQATSSGAPQDFQKYGQEVLAKEKYLGITPDKQKILPDSYNQAQILKNMPSGDDAKNFVDQLQVRWGPMFPKVMTEISNQDKSLSKYQAMTYASPQARADLADAIKNEKDINTAFIASPGAVANHAAIKQLTQNKMEDFQKSFLTGTNSSARLNVVNSISDAVMLQARRDMVSSGDDAETVVKNAYDKTIKNQFYFEGGGNSRVLVPRAVGGIAMEEGAVSDFLRQNSSPEGLKTLAISVPKSYESETKYLEQLSENGRWVTNGQMNGLELKIRDPRSGSYLPVYDKSGKPIEKSYQDIQTTPHEKSSFLGNLFGPGGTD